MCEPKPEQELPLNEPIEREKLEEFRKRYQHDAFCKDKLRNVNTAKKFLEYVLKPTARELLDLDGLEVVSESFVDEELNRSYADVLYRTPVKGRDESIFIFILIELKTEDDRWTVFQMAKYVVRIWDRTLNDAKDKQLSLKTFMLPMVIPIIFHHGGSDFTSPTKLIDLVRAYGGCESYVLNMECLLCDVTPIQPEGMPQDRDLEILFMALQTVFNKNVLDGLLAIHAKLEPTMDSEETQDVMEDILYYASTSASSFNKKECDVFFKQTNFRMGKRVMSLIDTMFAEGKAEGFAKSIMSILKKRFKCVPEHIENTVRNMSDTVALESLVVDAAVCNSLDEFNELLPD
ncbi:MAG: Rpn family recombination-promoting nuclease/putative transposase [Planctomycetaceae bacterium]|jgi:hypothetical protein|nr:Rpn family recombination-promoting nuclease/putative transposase [Planctomycetaceae bacterium]